jgi:hypothetical protein
MRIEPQTVADEAGWPRPTTFSTALGTAVMSKHCIETRRNR